MTTIFLPLPNSIIKKIYEFLENKIRLFELKKIDTINFALMLFNYNILIIDITSRVNLIHKKSKLLNKIFFNFTKIIINTNNINNSLYRLCKNIFYYSLNLSYLTFDINIFNKSKSLTYLLNNLKNLTYLNFAGSNFNQPLKNLLDNLPNLTHLFFICILINLSQNH